MTASVARGTIQRARFFSQQANSAGAESQRVAFQFFLEAAIVFGRSVTFHLQAQYRHVPGFDAWYAAWQERLKSDRLAAFLLDRRNYVLKEGPLPSSAEIALELSETVSIAESIEVRVIRGQPWYRRSLKILIGDATYPLREGLRQWREERHRARIALPGKRASGVASSSLQLRFVEPPWNTRPALELIDEYLSTLERGVHEAEATFGSPNSEAAQQGVEADEAR